jgi:predicted flap endonuclease-1-like 5' DNA nuclease
VSDWPAGVPAPARRALDGAGYTSLDQLTSLTEKELAALHGMGPKAIRLLREALAAQGKSFKPAQRD